MKPNDRRRVRHRHPTPGRIPLISAWSENSRASAALFPAFKFAVQARTTASMRSV
jgi:hypothetical protein